jgi:hypothetical protein
MLEEQYCDDNDNDNDNVQRILVAMPESRPFGWCFAG